MAFEELTPDPLIPAEAPPPEEASNRPFLIAIGALGLMLVLGLGCLAAFVFYFAPQQRAAQAQATQQAQQVDAESQKLLQQTAVALAVSQTSAVLSLTPAATFTPVPPTHTPVVVVADTATPTAGAHTATVSALLTQAAQVQLTHTPDAAGGGTDATVTATPASGGSSGSAKGQSPSQALPKAGFADEVGLPGLLGMAAALVGLIFLARRLRSALN